MRQVLLAALVVAMGVAAAHFGWRWFVRQARGERDDANFDAAAIMLLWGCGVIALAALGLVYGLLRVLGWT